MRRIEARRKNASAFRLRFSQSLGERLSIEILPILSEPSAAIEPGNSALDDPAFGQHNKSADLIGTFNDFNVEMRQNFCRSSEAGDISEGITGSTR
jgi:hypothetical protein